MPFDPSSPYSESITADGRRYYTQGGQNYDTSGVAITAPVCVLPTDSMAVAVQAMSVANAASETASAAQQGMASLKTIRTGFVTVTITDLTKAVSFATPMPSEDYTVGIQPEGGIAVRYWPSSKGVNGFTLNVSAGVATTFAYQAIQN